MVDWNEQWRQHAPHFYSGKVHLDLGEGRTIYLTPGPGFGDLSHPTTQLVLRMMLSHVHDKTVIDIGSGSGVLALSAAALGAKQVIGIDIDPEAIVHAQENALLNHLNVNFVEPHQFNLSKKDTSVVVLMNMIISEQMEAWHAISKKHSLSGTAFTSGILSEQRSDYLDLLKKWEWKPTHIEQEDQWLGFRSTF